MLEVQIATDNAIHWQGALAKANESAAELRTQLYRARDLLRRTNSLITNGRCELRPRNHNMDRVMDDLSADIEMLLRSPNEL